ncbi:hypothetical protein BpHYR1_001513 [Brachionus plicatilis]|uniref:Uncharacterized protein n=1 Tax=Brachionus plicatilis TaxID=10195 RepID=A0A3M7QSL1_BRAPC|nr:hypothetical protein BpHYR1_001513 [Brachionus plicatilis]
MSVCRERVYARSRLRSTYTSSTDSDECMQLHSEPKTGRPREVKKTCLLTLIENSEICSGLVTFNLLFRKFMTQSTKLFFLFLFLFYLIVIIYLFFLILKLTILTTVNEPGLVICEVWRQ